MKHKLNLTQPNTAENWWNFLFKHDWSSVTWTHTHTHKSSSNSISSSKRQTYFQINLQSSRNTEPYAHNLVWCRAWTRTQSSHHPDWNPLTPNALPLWFSAQCPCSSPAIINRQSKSTDLDLSTAQEKNTIWKQMLIPRKIKGSS